MADEKMIERWRFDKLRQAMAVALQISGSLLRQQEEGDYLDKDAEYEKTVELVAALAKGLHDGTQP